MDLLKFLHRFVKDVLCISRPLPNKTKLKFDQYFKSFWSFCFELKLLKESMHLMPFWVRCAFGNVIEISIGYELKALLKNIITASTASLPSRSTMKFEKIATKNFLRPKTEYLRHKLRYLGRLIYPHFSLRRIIFLYLVGWLVIWSQSPSCAKPS